MTATFSAEVFDPTVLFAIEMVQFLLGLCQGTEFKDGCSPGQSWVPSRRSKEIGVGSTPARLRKRPPAEPIAGA